MCKIILLSVIIACGGAFTASAAYVKIDGNGNIVAMYANQQPSMSDLQEIPDGDPRVVAFQQAQAKMLSTARPDRLTNLIDLLVKKNLISAADAKALSAP